MTEASGLQEFVSAYVLETEEHLENASTQLLSIEKSIRAGNANLKGVREAFRSLHTIKGLSAMVGVEPVVLIAHRMEAILRSSDRRGAKLPLESIDVLLRGVRSIRSRVEAFARGKPVAPVDAGLMRDLDALDSDHGEPVALPTLDLEPALANKLGALELEQLRAGLEQGQRALRVDFRPSAEKSARGTTINRVRELVSRLGEIVKVFPVSSPGGGEGGGLSFVIVFLTSAPTATVADATGVEASSIQILAEARERQLALHDADPELTELSEPMLDDVHVPQRAVVRVVVSRLDEMVEGLSALIVTRYRLARSVKALRDTGADTRELEEIVGENARQLRALRASILRVRLVPVAELLDRIPLIVRGLCRTMDRRVRVELESGGAELDKAVAERLFPALIHLIRNAVDHAIETPDERARRGKPEEGLLRIECSNRSNRWLELRISDDGRGIDTEAVARRAGVAAPGAAAGLLDLICRSGLSTREQATTVSGRGMGMEIVKRVVTEQLSGELSLQTELGLGTTFSLLVPLSISVVDAFSFLSGGQRFVTPVGTVESIVEVDAGRVVEGPSLGKGAALRLLAYRDRAVPLFSLASLFSLPVSAPEQRALVVRRGDGAVAFTIDRMLGQQEIVVRPLNDQLVKVPGVTGATDLGDGQPTLVLDMLSLGKRMAGGELRTRA